MKQDSSFINLNQNAERDLPLEKMGATLKKELNDLKSPGAAEPHKSYTDFTLKSKDQEEKKSPFEDVPSSNFGSAQQQIEKVKELKIVVREEYKNDEPLIIKKMNSSSSHGSSSPSSEQRDGQPK
jgi:hypothetical protein